MSQGAPVSPYIDFWGLRVFWRVPFLCETENDAVATIFIFFILINRAYC